MNIEFDAIYDGKVFKPTTPIDLPEGTKILITEIIDEGNGKPVLLKGHIVKSPQDSVKDTGAGIEE